VPTELQIYFMFYYTQRVTRSRCWLRHCSTRRKVAGSISDGVLGIFPSHNPRLDSATNRIEYQGCFLQLKRGRCIGLTSIQPLYIDCLEISAPQNSGTPRACPCMNRSYFAFLLHTARRLKSMQNKLLLICNYMNIPRYTVQP